MARFCTSCGTQANDDQKFCNKCGGQLGSPASSTPATSTPKAAPVTPTSGPAVQPGGAAPAAATAPPTKSGSSVVKIIVAVVAVLTFFGVLAIGSCFYIGYKIKQKAQDIAQSTRAPRGTSSTPELHLTEGGAGSTAAASATVDVPPYPGSTATESGGELSAGATGGASAQEYETPDSVDKVVNFYKEKFGSKINVTESGGNATFFYLTTNGMTTVTISRDEEAGKTKINIARIGK